MKRPKRGGETGDRMHSDCDDCIVERSLVLLVNGYDLDVRPVFQINFPAFFLCSNPLDSGLWALVDSLFEHPGSLLLLKSQQLLAVSYVIVQL